MKDNELIKIIVETFIIEKNFKFNKADIKNILQESIDVKINQIKEENYDDIKVLYVYFGGKNKKCLTFTIQNENIRIDEII